LAFYEILEQCAALGTKPDWVVVAGGTGSTAAGLAVGAGLWSPETRIASISVSWSRQTLEAEIGRHVESAAAIIDADVPPDGTFRVFDDYIGPGYSRPSDSGCTALRLMAEQEGVVLDTTYTAKAMAGLVDLARRNVVVAGSKVVFVHTGGTPELFTRDPSILPT
jgi:1-aminocyclopropane-1-carboxylate deaminase/D-cysteine desulfhydrase-like pyridoxal-dependent ACC family enzyme